MADALFERLGVDRFHATSAARGPWSPDALHGGPVAALLARAVEPALEDLFPTRLTIELLRPVPLAELVVTTETVRPGRKVRLVAASLTTVDGTAVATATALGIRRSEVPVPDVAATAVPPGPDTVPATDRSGLAVTADWDAFHNTGVEHRFVAGSFVDPGPATDWIRLRVPVVAGEPTTPLQRVAAAADFGNGISSVADFTTLLFINPDLTIHLHDLPVGEWVALEASTHLAGHGVGLAQSRLWDERGPLGRALQSLLLDAR